MPSIGLNRDAQEYLGAGGYLVRPTGLQCRVVHVRHGSLPCPRPLLTLTGGGPVIWAVAGMMVGRGREEEP